MNTSTYTPLYSPVTSFNDPYIVREIVVCVMGQPIMVKPGEITCLEGEGNYTYIYTSRGKKYLVSRTLKSIMEHLDTSFIRVHKSYIINSCYIAERLDDERIIRMSCGKEVTVARRKAKEIVELLDGIENRISA
jgi:DNA-binding LytR/AlgR family response regulator